MATEECPICFEPLYMPCTLPCGHRFNSACLLRVLARVPPAEEPGERCAPCPHCRTKFSASALDLSGLRNRLRDAAPHGYKMVILQDREIQLALHEFDAPPGELDRGWLRLWHFVAAFIACVSIAIGALVYDPPKAWVTPTGGTPREPWPAARRAMKLLDLLEPLQLVTGSPIDSLVYTTASVLIGEQDMHDLGWRGRLGLARPKQQQSPPTAPPLPPPGTQPLSRSDDGEGDSGRKGKRKDNEPVWDARRCQGVAAHDAAHGKCAPVWVGLARDSLRAGRPEHAAAHAERAVGKPAVAKEAAAGGVTGRLRPPRDGKGGSSTANRGGGLGGAARAEGLYVLAPPLGRYQERPTVGSAVALLESARLGHAPAQVALAQRLEEGGGAIEADAAAAAGWYAAGARASAPADGGAALRRWGVLLASGAVAAATEAELGGEGGGGEEGGIGGMGGMGGVGGGAAEQAHTLFGAAAAAGDVDAMFNLAKQLEHGDGCGRDAAAALRWYDSAAAAGHVWGVANAARLREEGGDLVAACNGYVEAAELGDADAQHSAARMLRTGRGCARDAAAAHRWLAAAAAQGQPAAMAELRRTPGEPPPAAAAPTPRPGRFHAEAVVLD